MSEPSTPISNINLTQIQVRRLGASRQDGSARTLLVQLSNFQDVMQVIKNRNLLPKGISVSSDKTRSHREQLKQLYAKAAAHNNNNPTPKLIVKYVIGTLKGTSRC